jgi:hypothetical protein
MLLTDFVCLYNYEFGLSLRKIVRSSVILLLPLFKVNNSVLNWDNIFNLGKLSHSHTTSPITVSDWKHSKYNLMIIYMHTIE